MRNKRIKKMCITALSVAFLSLCSWISFPLVIPFTMQTFAVFLILLFFGGKIGLLSVLLYLLLGSFGLPVFSSFGAGFGVLLGPSGGFLWGFLTIALIYLGFERFCQNKPFLRFTALVLGMLTCYLTGAWFYALYISSFAAVNFASFVSALLLYVLPFVVPDALKLVLAFALHQKLKRFIKS